MITSIVYFFSLFLGIGLIISKLIKLDIENSIEKIFISIGIGLGVFPLLVCIMHLLHIPFDYRLFLPFFLGLIYLKDIKQFKFDKYDLIAVSLFIMMFFCMFYGSTKYSYLEDSDPWGHALSSKYVSIEKNAWTPEGFYFHYIDPYPPTYSIMMGILHQTNNNIKTTLKFFNSLLIGLTIIFFYYFSKKYINNKIIAILSTFIIFSLPSFMSHFIWAQTLAIPLMIISFYMLETLKNYKYYILCGIIIAGVLLTQPSTAVIFTIMIAIYFMIKIIFIIKEQRTIDILSILYTSIVCIITAGIYWFSMFSIYGFNGTLDGIGLHTNTLGSGDTSGGVIYKLADFVIPPLTTKIDQPIGLGMFIFFILIIYFVLIISNYKKFITLKKSLITFCWLIFTFIGVMGNALPFKLFPHRFWVYFSIPIAIIVGELIYSIYEYIKTNYNKYFGYIFVVFIIFGVLLTSAYPKFIVNNSYWPAGPQVGNQIQGLYYLDTLPLDTKVFNYYVDRDLWMTGMNKLSYEWKPEIIQFRKTLINITIQELYNFLKENNYEYLYISTMAYENFVYWYGENNTINHLNNLVNSLNLNTDNFINIYNKQNILIYKII